MEDFDDLNGDADKNCNAMEVDDFTSKLPLTPTSPTTPSTTQWVSMTDTNSIQPTIKNSQLKTTTSDYRVYIFERRQKKIFYYIFLCYGWFLFYKRVLYGHPR